MLESGRLELASFEVLILARRTNPADWFLALSSAYVRKHLEGCSQPTTESRGQGPLANIVFGALGRVKIISFSYCLQGRMSQVNSNLDAHRNSFDISKHLSELCMLLVEENMGKFFAVSPFRTMSFGSWLTVARTAHICCPHCSWSTDST